MRSTASETLGGLCLLLLTFAALQPLSAQVSIEGDSTAWQTTLGDSTVIDFDDLSSGEPLGSQYTGATFSPFDAGSPSTCDNFTLSDPLSLNSHSNPCSSGGGGGYAIDFDPPVVALGFWAGDVQFPGTVIELLDAGGAVIDSVDLFDSPGLSCSCPSSWKFVGLTSITPIARIQQSIAPNDAVWFDDFQFSIPSLEFVRGDNNSDGQIDIADAVYLLTYLFSGGPACNCEDACDDNDDGDIDISDSIYLLSFLFSAGSSPPSPWPTCGSESTADDLDCASSPCT